MSENLYDYLGSFLDLNISPARVIMKDGALEEISECLMSIGDDFLFICGRGVYEKVRKFFKNAGFIAERRTILTASDSCNYAETERIYALAEKAGGFDGIIAAGGGTVLDVAKIVAYHCRKPLITVPTSAATCAAFTSLAVVYDGDSIFSHYDYLNKNPDLCVIEPRMIMEAGPRLLAAGFADSVAKYVEGVWSYSGKPKDFYSELGLSIAHNLTNEILSIGKRALSDAAAGELTREVFDAISYNVIASGLSSGIAGMKIYPNVAHSISNGVTAVINGQNYLDAYHGEAISLGLAVGSLIMPDDGGRIKNIISALGAFGLPVKLSALLALSPAAKSMSAKDAAARIVEKAMAANESVHDISFVTRDILYKALLETDRIY